MRKKKQLTEQEIRDWMYKKELRTMCYSAYFGIFGYAQMPDETRIEEIASMIERHDYNHVEFIEEIIIDKYGRFLKFPFKELFDPDLDVANMNLEGFQRGDDGCPVAKWIDERREAWMEKHQDDFPPIEI